MKNKVAPHPLEPHTLGYESATPVQRIRVSPQLAAKMGGLTTAGDADHDGNGWMMEQHAGEFASAHREDVPPPHAVALINL